MKRIFTLFIALVCLFSPLYAEDGMTLEKEMEVVSSPIVTEDPVTTFLNLYSYLQRDMGEGGLIIMDNETMELITATGTSHTPAAFFGNTFPDNTMIGYIPSVPADVASVFAAMVPDSRHAIEALKPYIAEDKDVFLFIGMRLENVPEDTVIKPLDVFYIEEALRDTFNHRGLDADKAFALLCEERDFESVDDLIIYVIENPTSVETLIAEAASLMYPRTALSDNSALITFATMLFAVALALALIGLGILLSKWLRKNRTEKETEEKKE